MRLSLNWRLVPVYQLYGLPTLTFVIVIIIIAVIIIIVNIIIITTIIMAVVKIGTLVFSLCVLSFIICWCIATDVIPTLWEMERGQ